MPILWRYLLKSYFQVFLLCVTGFISVLLVTRFQEIARFATSGASVSSVFLFGLYQIPYILPITIPISCLIAAMLLYQKLSHTHELTALRSAGYSLFSLVYPLILAGGLLAFFNFTIVSEIAPYCKAKSRELIYDMTAKNPLFLLQKETLVKMKESYSDMKTLKSGKSAEDLVFVLNNASSKRLGILVAKELFLEGEMLTGKYVSLISSVEPKNSAEGFDHLIIENQKTMSTKASNLSQFIQSHEWPSNYDYFPLRMILAKEGVDHEGQPMASKAKMEIAKRLSLGLATLTFTILGIAFGMQIGRGIKKRGILWGAVLAASYMVAFVSAKSFRDQPSLAVMIYLLPHPIIILISLRPLQKLSRGFE